MGNGLSILKSDNTLSTASEICSVVRGEEIQG
jgi:hypothetical protein